MTKTCTPTKPPKPGAKPSWMNVEGMPTESDKKGGTTLGQIGSCVQ